MWIPSVDDLMGFQAWIIVESWKGEGVSWSSISSDYQQRTFIANNANEVLLLGVTQHVFLQVLLLLEGRLATFVFALEWTILAMHVLDVNLQLRASCECRRTLVAVVVFDLEMAFQMLFDVLLLERSQSADIALEPFLLQMHSLIVATQVRC